MCLLILEIFAQNAKGNKKTHTICFFAHHVNYLSRAYLEKARLVVIWIKVSCVLSLYSWLKASFVFVLHVVFNVLVVATATKILLSELTLEMLTDFHSFYIWRRMLMHIICISELIPQVRLCYTREIVRWASRESALAFGNELE